MRQIVATAFNTFFSKQKSYYPDSEGLPWHFTGSVAAHFEEVLRESAETSGCQIGEITGDPMTRLCSLSQNHSFRKPIENCDLWTVLKAPVKVEIVHNPYSTFFILHS